MSYPSKNNSTYTAPSKNSSTGNLPGRSTIISYLLKQDSFKLLLQTGGGIVLTESYNGFTTEQKS